MFPIDSNVPFWKYMHLQLACKLNAIFFHLNKFNILPKHYESASKTENYTKIKRQTFCSLRVFSNVRFMEEKM